MSAGRVNAAFELVSSMRQSLLTATKQSLEKQAAESAADDRRKLSIFLATAPPQPTVRRYFTPSEITELKNVMMDLANANTEMGVALGSLAQEFVPPDHRGDGFWDYFAINLFKCGRHADAYIIWNRAAAAQADTNQAPAPKDQAPKDAEPPTLPVRPRVRPNKQGATEKDDETKKEDAKKEEVALEKKEEAEKGDKALPLRPRVRRRAADEPAETGQQQEEGKKEDGGKDGKEGPKEAKKEEPKKDEGGADVFVRADYGNLSHVRHNMQFALEKLRCKPPSSDQLPTIDKLFKMVHRCAWTSVSIPARFHAFNPSIIPHPTDPSRKFLVNLRAGNYFMNAMHKYEFPPGMSGITTLNFLGSISMDFRESEFGETKQIKSPPMPNPYPAICGLEDIRLLWEPVSKKLYASFTSLEVTPEHRPQVCLMQIDHRKGRVVGNPVRLHGLDSDKSQKNWIGFADGGKLYFIYSLQPIVVLQANPKSGEVKVVSVDCCPIINEFRGSSPLIDLPPALIAQLPMTKNYGAEEREADARRGVRWFIALVHASHFPKYHHQIIVMKKTPCEGSEFRPFSMAITHQTPPFVFESHNVEFSCGMAFNADHSELVVPYSMRDNNCTCARLDTDSVLKQLHPAPSVADFRFHS